MVELFYYQNWGKCCKKIWKHQGKTLKVSLHFEEVWAETSGHAHLLLQPLRPSAAPWAWLTTRRSRRARVDGGKHAFEEKVKVTEVRGTRRRTGIATVTEQCASGALWIRGHFKESSKPSAQKAINSDFHNHRIALQDSDREENYFKLTLTSNVSHTDFHMGYCLTGTLETSTAKYAPYRATHMAFVRRKDLMLDPTFSGSDHIQKSNRASSSLVSLTRDKSLDFRALSRGWRRLKVRNGHEQPVEASSRIQVVNNLFRRLYKLIM